MTESQSLNCNLKLYLCRYYKDTSYKIKKSIFYIKSYLFHLYFRHAVYVKQQRIYYYVNILIKGTSKYQRKNIQ